MDTTIRLDVETKAQLDLFREYKNESYDEIIRKLVFVAKSCEEDIKTAKSTVIGINEAREKIKTSGRYTKAEVKKILNLK